MICPTCEKGTLKKTRIKEYMHGTYLGEFEAQECNNCKETYTDQETTKIIIDKTD